jgi:hypothetical protein
MPESRLSNTRLETQIWLAGIVAALLIFLISSCGKGPDGPGDHPKIVGGERYFPMADGDTWFYNSAAVIREVDGDTTINGYVCKKVLQGTVTAQAWSITSERFAQHLLEETYIFDPPLEIPLDLEKGTPHEFNSLGINSAAIPGSQDPVQVDSVRTIGKLSFDGYVTKTINQVDLDSCIKLDYDYTDHVYYADGDSILFPNQYSEYYARNIGLIDDGDIVLDQARIDGVMVPQRP